VAEAKLGQEPPLCLRRQPAVAAMLPRFSPQQLKCQLVVTASFLPLLVRFPRQACLLLAVLSRLGCSRLRSLSMDPHLLTSRLEAKGSSHRPLPSQFQPRLLLMDLHPCISPLEAKDSFPLRPAQSSLPLYYQLRLRSTDLRLLISRLGAKD
jgi:hypothetical protein